MGVAFRSASSLAAGTRTNSTLTAPSGITNGDVLLLILAVGHDPAVTTTPPSGFAALTGFPVDMTFPPDTWVARFNAWFKIASSESGNYTATHSSASTEGWLGCYSGGGAASPINPAPAITDHAVGGGGAVLIAPTITPLVDSSAVVWVGQNWDGTGAASPPTGTTPTFTERLNVTTETLYVADGVLTTAGATGTKSVTSTQGDNRPWIAALICIEAAASAAVSDIQSGRIPTALLCM